MLPNLSQLFFSFLSGLLTTLSPCVLPILPFVIGGAIQENVLAPLYLSLGLILSFVTIGWSVSAFGSLLGFDSDTIRTLAGIGLCVVGIILLVPRLQESLTAILTPLAGRADKTLQRHHKKGFLGNVLTGVLLGAVWSPCSGPTLGSAIVLASTEGGGLKSGIMMFCFAVGAVAPLLAMSYGAQGFIQCHKGRIMNVVIASKKIFGATMVVVGIGIGLGWDKKLESYFVERMSASWVEITSKF